MPCATCSIRSYVGELKDRGSRRYLAVSLFPGAALEIRHGKGVERLHEALQGRLHHASADLPYPSLAMGNAGVDPGHDGRCNDLVVSAYLLRQ